MRKTAFTEEQVAHALRQAESGTPVAEVCRKLGISEQTFYRWKKKSAGMGVAELRRLRQLEDENRQLKQLVADLTLDKHMLRGRCCEKAVKPTQMRDCVHFLQEDGQPPLQEGERVVLYDADGLEVEATIVPFTTPWGEH